MKHMLFILLVCLMLGVLAGPVEAVDSITVTSNSFTNNFRQDLKFELRAQSSAGNITQAALYIAVDGVASISRELPTFTPDKLIRATYQWRLNTSYLPPGATGQYWWTIDDSAGNRLTTGRLPFRVEDSSKRWKNLRNDQFVLYWYDGSDEFGRVLFDRGVQAIEYLQLDVGITVDKPTQIFIYGDGESFARALPLGSPDWTGGRAFPDYGIILIHIAPTKPEWGKGTMTHELTHLIIEQKIRSPLGPLSMPNWMSEGLAMYYETYPGKLDPQFANPLRLAILNDSMPRLRTLSGNFTEDSDAVALEYAESYAIVDFIYRRYGKDKMAALLQEFKKGGDPDEILRRVLGVNTDELDNEWRQSVGLKPRAIPTRPSGSLTPIPTYCLSTNDDSACGATPTPSAVTVNPTPAATHTPTPGPATSVAFIDDYEGTCLLAIEDDNSHRAGCENGEYVIVNKEGGYVWRQGYPNTFRDAIISVEGRAPTGDAGIEYGLAIRVSPGSQYYFFALSPLGTYSLYYYAKADGWTDIVPPTLSPAVKKGGEKNRLLVIMQGDQFALYANDQFLTTVSYPKLASGTMALALSSRSGNSKAIFDNLIISKINRPLVLPVK